MTIHRKELERLGRVLRKNAETSSRLGAGDQTLLRRYFEPDGTPDGLDVLAWFWDPPVEFAKPGSHPDWRGGRVTEAGWYTMPYCAPGCCRPYGPFRTRKAAIRDAQRGVIESLLRPGVSLDIGRLIAAARRSDQTAV